MSADKKDVYSTVDSNSEGAETDNNLEEGELGPKEYLGYWVLREREKTGGQPISRSVFWKLCCLADRRLLDKFELNIKFPRHWYKYGEVGEVHSLSREFFNAPKARFWEGQEFHTKEIPETDFQVEIEKRKAIRQVARETVRDYEDCSAQDLKRVQYRHYSPNGFIRSYSHLREYLERLDEIDTESDDTQQTGLDKFVNNEERAHIERLLDEMITTFPREEYSDVYRLYLRWDDTMRMLYEQNRSVHEQKVFLEMFVEKLSEITLRFEHNHAIPPEKIEDWFDERDDRIRELNDGIEATREECLSRRQTSGELDSIAEIYDQVVIEQF